MRGATELSGANEFAGLLHKAVAKAHVYSVYAVIWCDNEK